ncbi:hypothetical protein [uncultured Methanobrevibacter sp.]|uniref:hypothetical protein n=1 Tax=uncultured Methanobrevibacter sp. TaxID=253161 RepID=UPI002639FCE8|nr:hypothetical protein [uncultured Methanobrevibacter sp.]
MSKQTTQQKIQELNDDGITFDRYNNKLVVYNNNHEYLISENALELTIRHGIKRTVFDESDIFNLFRKYEVYEPLTFADYERVLEEHEILRKEISNIGSLEDNDAVKFGLNYFINHERDSGSLYQTLKIINNFDKMSELPLVGFQYENRYRAKILEIFGIDDFGDFSRALYNKSYALLESEYDKLLLTKNKNLRFVDGVRYNGLDEVPLTKIIDYGKIYNDVYRNLRVKCGCKFNQKPSTYNLMNSFSLVHHFKIEYHDRFDCGFTPRRLRCSL